MHCNNYVSSFCLLLTILASVQCANVCDMRSGGGTMVCNCDGDMSDEELNAALNQEEFNVGALKFMNMIGCGLGTVICDNDGLPEGCNTLFAQAAQAATLRSIILNDNDLVNVPTFIKSMSSLEDLYLDSNKITDLRVNGFSGAKRVTTMELDRNQLTRLRFGVFNGLNSLKKLILSNNMISTIDVGTFDSLGDLTVLSLNHNSLAQVFKLTYDLPSLCQLTLADNGLVKVEKGSFAKPPSTCATPFVRGLGMSDGNPLRCPGLVLETGKYMATECTCVNAFDNETSISVLCNKDFMACDAICGDDRDRFVVQGDYDDDDANTRFPEGSSSTTNNGDAENNNTEARSGLIPGLVIPGVMIVLGLVGFCYYKSTEAQKKSRSNSIASSGTSLDQLDYALATGTRGNGRQNDQLSTRNFQAAETRLPPGIGARNGALPPVSGSTSRLSPMQGSPNRLPDMMLPEPEFSRSPPLDPFASHDRRISVDNASPARSSKRDSGRVEPLRNGSNPNTQRLLGPSVSNDQIASPVQTDYPRRQNSSGRLPAIGGGGALQRGSLPPIAAPAGRMSRNQRMVMDIDASDA